MPNISQSTQTLTGLHVLMSLIPAAASIISIISILAYNLTEERHR